MLVGFISGVYQEKALTRLKKIRLDFLIFKFIYLVADSCLFFCYVKIFFFSNNYSNFSSFILILYQEIKFHKKERC